MPMFNNLVVLAQIDFFKVTGAISLIQWCTQKREKSTHPALRHFHWALYWFLHITAGTSNNLTTRHVTPLYG